MLKDIFLFLATWFARYNFKTEDITVVLLCKKKEIAYDLISSLKLELELTEYPPISLGRALTLNGVKLVVLVRGTKYENEN